MAKEKFKTGTKELDADEFDPAFSKVLISIRVPGDVLAHFKKLAAERGTKYQTIINQVLKESMGQKPDLEQRLEKLEQASTDLLSVNNLRALLAAAGITHVGKVSAPKSKKGKKEPKVPLGIVKIAGSHSKQKRPS